VDEKSQSSNIADRTSGTVLKGRGSADVVRSMTGNHVNIPGLLASDGIMQAHLHHVQSAVQPPTTAVTANSAVVGHRK
jgi:hypothetical protein